MSPVVRNPDFCICENKDTDQLRGNREADQLLCFRYIDTCHFQTTMTFEHLFHVNILYRLNEQSNTCRQQVPLSRVGTSIVQLVNSSGKWRKIPAWQILQKSVKWQILAFMNKSKLKHVKL